MKKWLVYLNKHLIDEVFYSRDCDAQYVKESFVYHDGYDSNIVVIRAN